MLKDIQKMVFFFYMVCFWSMVLIAITVGYFIHHKGPML